MARPKKTSSEIASIEAAGHAVHRLLLAQIELEKYTGRLDLARAEATAKYEKEINAEKERIADLTLQLQNFYMANHEQLEPKGSKSLKLAHGTIGRRLGNPALKPLNRSWTWAAIAIKVRSIYSLRFFHPPAEPALDKEKVRTELNPDQLKTCGMFVDQDENFFVETDRSSLGEISR
ncbi:MAG TPA: host-nuclease inhibitor Gam family protein [Bryobacteraceae bacterium]|jgi:phage host-nuclease inhibitor protein Gam|nr:host-nuclease inhibitor Gam family protein [Bryobacteraceae bacterium]